MTRKIKLPTAEEIIAINKKEVERAHLSDEKWWEELKKEFPDTIKEEEEG